MSRVITVGAGQLGPVSRGEPRESVVERLIGLLEEASSRACDLVVFPELALTTFFPRWHIEEQAEIDAWFETEMPSPATKPLFARAESLRVGFSLGYAELTPEGRHYNTQVLVDANGEIVGKYRKVHIPGHDEPESWRPFQHLERYYFEPGPDGFSVWPAFGGQVGMMICNDRRWPETYRVMGLRGVELILCGYNTPIHYAPDPSQDALQGFHHTLVMQAGAYQNGTFVAAAAKGGLEEGVESLAQSCVIAPSGEIVAAAYTTSDELVTATCDLDWCDHYKKTVFDFDRYRMVEHYEPITRRRDLGPR